jgi:hypothetical protein
MIVLSLRLFWPEIPFDIVLLELLGLLVGYSLIYVTAT